MIRSDFKKMGPERQRKRKFSPDEVLVRHYLDLIERGEETVIRRISETLKIDSVTKPDEVQIRAFVKSLREETDARGSH